MNPPCPDPEKKDPFLSVGYLFFKKRISTGVIATAIEKEGIYTWDRFGRYIRASDGDEKDQRSKTCILDAVALLYEGDLAYEHERKLDPEHYFMDDDQGYEVLREDYKYPLNWFGWTSKEVPDFDTLLKESGQTNAPEKPRKEPAAQSAIGRLMKGLVVLHYGELMIEDLNKDKSHKLSEIKRDLELKGFSFDDKTLRKYLKD